MERGRVDPLPGYSTKQHAGLKPRRRWRVHYQFPGREKTIQSFEIKDRAVRTAEKIRSRGGEAMVEDRWNGQE